MDYIKERNDIIDELKLVSNKINDKKGLILKLAENLLATLDRPEVKIWASIEGIENPKKEDIMVLIRRLRDKHFQGISTRWIYEVLPKEYKKETKPSAESQVIRLTDKYIEDHAEELKKRIRDNTKVPASDIIRKERVEDMEQYTWKCFTAQELAKLAIKMEHDHDDKHECKLCEEYAKRVRMVRDSRFATDVNSYEAAIVAANATQTLKNAISGNFEFLTIWEIRDNEDNCKECLGIQQCKKEKCRHVCHTVVKPMTTKGYKYALKTNEYLGELDDQLKRLTEVQDDVCRIGKILFLNKKVDKFLNANDKNRVISNHIERDDCLQCDIFMKKHPKFFESHE